MKHFKLFFCKLVFFALTLLFMPVFMCMSLRSEVIPLNFDRLFPETSIQMVLENCMQLQHELNVRNDSMDEYEASWLVDSVVGRLFYLRLSVQEIINKKTPVHPEDAQYIFTLVEQLAITYNKKFQSIVPIRGKHVAVLFADLKKKLTLLIR